MCVVAVVVVVVVVVVFGKAAEGKWRIPKGKALVSGVCGILTSSPNQIWHIKGGSCYGSGGVTFENISWFSYSFCLILKVSISASILRLVCFNSALGRYWLRFDQ